jgi:hypothetical protein
MGFIAVVLWPIVPAKWASVTGLALAVPFTLSFLHDWLVASTTIDVESDWYQTAHRSIQQFFTGPLALTMRPLLVLALAALVFETVMNVTQVGQALVSIGLPFGTSAVALFLILELLGIPMIAVGMAPRLTSIVLFIPAGFTLIAGASQMACLVVIFAAIAILLLGPGPYTLWQPEAILFRHRLGTAYSD